MKFLKGNLFYSYVIIFICWCFVFEGGYAQDEFWEGIGPYGGNINCLTMDKLNPGVIFAGTDFGIFQTIDGGNHWEKIHAPEIKTVAIEIVGQNSAEIYVGTEKGLYYNRNSEEDWLLAGFQNLSVNAILIDPQNSDTLWVGTSGDSVGIFKSEDGGVTWQLKKQFKNWSSNSINDLLQDPNDPSIIYAAVTDGYSSIGFYKSTDFGEIWVSKKIGKISPRNISTLAITPSNYSPTTIYAVKDDEDVYKSIDLGESWQAVNIPAGINFTKPYGIAVDPIQPEIVYVGLGSGFYKSSDAGDSWTKLQNGKGGFASIQIDPQNSDVFVGRCGSTGGGVFRSTDGGMKWEPSNHGVQLTTIRDFAVLPDSDSIYAAIVNGETSLALYDFPDSNWHFFNINSCNGAIALNPQNHQELFGGPDYKYRSYISINKSVDGGKNWDSFNVFNLLQTTKLGVSDIWINPEHSDTVLAAIGGGSDYIGIDGGGLYYSTNGGQSWNRAKGSNVIPLPIFSVTSIVYDLLNQNLYFATQNWGYVYYSTNGGINWERISPGGYWVRQVNDLSVDRNSNIYAATDSGLFTWDQINWTEIAGLPEDNITAMVIDQGNLSDIYYVGTEKNGVFYSTDAGMNWSDFNPGVNKYNITKLDLGISFLYAGTKNNGVWLRRRLNSVDVHDKDRIFPVKFKLKQNYPNPFNPETTFEFSIPYSCEVKLCIYDILGRKITTLVDEKLSSGKYKKNWKPNNVACGVYYYKLHTGDFIKINKLLFLK